MDSAGLDHSHRSESAPQEVLRISQYPYTIGAKYSEPSSVIMDSEPSSLMSDPGSLVRALTPESELSVASTRTPSGRRGSGTSLVSDWNQAHMRNGIVGRGDPQWDPDPFCYRIIAPSSRAKCGKPLHAGGPVGYLDPRRGDLDP